MWFTERKLKFWRSWVSLFGLMNYFDFAFPHWEFLLQRISSEMVHVVGMPATAFVLYSSILKVLGFQPTGCEFFYLLLNLIFKYYSLQRFQTELKQVSESWENILQKVGSKLSQFSDVGIFSFFNVLSCDFNLSFISVWFLNQK